MPSQDKLIKAGIRYTDALFREIDNRLRQGVRTSDTLEAFLVKTKEYTTNNPLVTSGYMDRMLSIILQETNNHKFSRPTQKELTRITIENRVGEKIMDVGDDIKNSVRDIVKEGYNQGLSQDEIAEQISHRIGVIKNKRARAIARTEIARTATVSDYVISKERGATHFYVECRNTACPVCKKAWHSGWTEENDDTYTPHDKSAGGKGWIGDKTYKMSQTDKLPPIHVNCRCVAYFIKKEESKSEKREYSNKSNILKRENEVPLKRIGNVKGNTSENDPKKEFRDISKKGFIEYVDADGKNHRVNVKCKESHIVDFDGDDEIHEKLHAEECYEYQILDAHGNVKVTIYKSKNHNQFSMSQLMSVYDILDKTLTKECNEIILSSHILGRSGGCVFESNPHRVHIMGITDASQMESVLIHEIAHSFDLSNGISSSEEYIELVREHPSALNPYSEDDDEYFVEDFAYTIEELYSDFLPPIVKAIYLYNVLGKTLL